MASNGKVRATVGRVEESPSPTDGQTATRDMNHPDGSYLLDDSPDFGGEHTEAAERSLKSMRTILDPLSVDRPESPEEPWPRVTVKRGGIGWADAPRRAKPDELHKWWHDQADADLAMLLPKAVEYSAHDLRMTGHVLADMVGIAPVSDAFAAELACATYLMSKVTRILGAYKEGRLPTIDSIVDARVYATMMARIRDKGSWPGWNAAKTDTN